MGRATALGQWGWKLFARKGNRNIAVAAVARKLLIQVWHMLSGNPPTALETDKSFTLKLHKLAVSLGTSPCAANSDSATLCSACVQDASNAEPFKLPILRRKNERLQNQPVCWGLCAPKPTHRSPRQAFGGNFQYGLPASKLGRNIIYA